MSAKLVSLYEDQDPDKLRVSRPSKFVFLCGGAISKNANGRAENLRDYLCRVRPMRTKYKVVLAEKATQLYRETSYSDLISFEEDIARIAAVVVVIAESAGSLAELGAFSTNETIRGSLRVIISEAREKEESFVRYGPVERVLKNKREHLGVYPWGEHKNGRLIVTSVRPHYKEIVTFINEQIEHIPASTVFSRLNEEKLFYVIYWIIFICFAVSPAILYGYVRMIIKDVSDKTIRDKIYCMELAGWIGRIRYSGKDYFYVLHDDDPFNYAFRVGVADNASIPRKVELSRDLEKAEKLPKHVREVAAESRRSK